VLCYKSEGTGLIPASVSGFLIDIKSFRLHYGPGVDSASNRNEYQEYFLGGKGGRCVRMTTYHHPVPLSRYLGTLTSWNPLGPSGTVTGLLYLYLCADKHIQLVTQPRQKHQVLRECADVQTCLHIIFTNRPSCLPLTPTNMLIMMLMIVLGVLYCSIHS